MFCNDETSSWKVPTSGVRIAPGHLQFTENQSSINTYLFGLWTFRNPGSNLLAHGIAALVCGKSQVDHQGGGLLQSSQGRLRLPWAVAAGLVSPSAGISTPTSPNPSSPNKLANEMLGQPQLPREASDNPPSWSLWLTGHLTHTRAAIPCAKSLNPGVFRGASKAK